MMRPFYCRIVMSPVDPNLRRTPVPRVSQVVATGKFEREHGGGGRHSRRREHRATDLKQPQRSSERQSTRGFDAGFLDPTGYLMTVHARRREVDDDERRMSGSIHCTVLEGYVFFSMRVARMQAVLAGRRWLVVVSSATTNDNAHHICVCVFFTTALTGRSTRP